MYLSGSLLDPVSFPLFLSFTTSPPTSTVSLTMTPLASNVALTSYSVEIVGSAEDAWT